MADYNKVQIGNVFLTDDGLVTGTPCRAQVAGLDGLQLSHAGDTVKAADGSPYNFVVAADGSGSDIEIRPFVVTADVLADLRAAIDDAIASIDTVNVKITDGPFGDFELECLPLFPRPIEFSGEFSTDRISDLVLRFTVQSVTP
jgi:hypothetical protein